MAGLMTEEQELHISAGRTENMAIAYCSDSTWITKFDKLVEKSPELFKVVRKDEVSKTYEFPKRLISIRSGFREISEKQRIAMSERMKKYQANKKADNN